MPERFFTFARSNALLQLFSVSAGESISAGGSGFGLVFFIPAVLAIGNDLDLAGNVIDALLRECFNLQKLLSMLVHEHDVKGDGLPLGIFIRAEADVDVDFSFQRPIHSQPAVTHGKIYALAYQKLFARSCSAIEQGRMELQFLQ